MFSYILSLIIQLSTSKLRENRNLKEVYLDRIYDFMFTNLFKNEAEQIRYPLPYSCHHLVFITLANKEERTNKTANLWRLTLLLKKTKYFLTFSARKKIEWKTTSNTDNVAYFGPSTHDRSVHPGPGSTLKKKSVVVVPSKKLDLIHCLFLIISTSLLYCVIRSAMRSLKLRS